MYNRVSSIQTLKNQIANSKYSETEQSNFLQETIEKLRQDPKFAGFSDFELQNYAQSIIMEHNTATRSRGFERVVSLLGKPVDDIWSQFTYEEILLMEDGGVVIPEDFLQWAHSMEEADTSDYELDETDSLNENGADTLRADAGSSGSVGEKKTVKALSRQIVLKEEALKQAQSEFEQYSSTLEASSSEAKTRQNESLQRIQSMLGEWQVLDKKAKSGEPLTAEEQTRYGQIGNLMNTEVKASNAEISNYSADFDEISALIKSTSKDATLAQNFVRDADLMGNLVPQQEGRHGYMSLDKNSGFTGAFGLMDILKSSSIGKNITVDTLKNSADLQSVMSTSNKSLKQVSNKMETMTESVDSGNAGIQEEADSVKTDSAGEDVGEVPETPPPPPEGMDAPPPTNAKSPEDEEQENRLIGSEDLNNINSVLKRQQKKAPEPELEDIVIE